MDQAQEALTHFQAASDATDDAAVEFDARLQAGHILVQSGEYAAAIEVLETASRISNPEQLPALLFLMGQAYLASDEADQAEAVLRRLRDEHADSPYMLPATLALARSLMQLNQYDEARVIVEALVDADDASIATAARFELAQLSRLQGNFEAAITAYREVVKHEAPAELAAAALYWAGRCHERLAQPTEAAAVYQRLIAGHPDQTQWVEQAQQRLAQLRTVGSED
jgi:tetratricopeptide (TPR) repeat protein